MAKPGVRHYKRMTAISPSKLATLRASRQTQEQFSERTGLSVQRISQAETGKPIPDSCANVYARGLGRVVEDLFVYLDAGVNTQYERISTKAGIAKLAGQQLTGVDQLKTQVPMSVAEPNLSNPSIHRITESTVNTHLNRFPMHDPTAVGERNRGDLSSESDSRKIRAPEPLAERRVGLRDNLIVGCAVETLVHSTLNSRTSAPLCGWDPARVTIVDTEEFIDCAPILARLSGGLLPLGPNEANNLKFVLSECPPPFKDDEENLTLSFQRSDWQTHKTVRNSPDGVEHNEELALEFGSLDVGLNRVPSSVGLHYLLRFADDTILLMKRRSDTPHDANRWSISGEEQFEASDFLNGTLLRVFQRTLCEEVFGLLERSPGSPERLQDRWDKFVARHVQSMRLWSLVFEERACVTSLLGFYQLGISVNEFAILRRELAQQCIGTRDQEGRVYWTTTAEIEQLLVRNHCRAWLLDGVEVATVESSKLGKTSRYRAYRAVRAIRGRLPGAPAFTDPETGIQSAIKIEESKLISPKEMSLITAEASVEHTLMHYSGGHVGAIQLYGAADRWVAPEQILVHYDPTPYVVPSELRAAGEERIKDLQDQAERGTISFFDGPCVRLLRWAASPPSGGPGAALERHILQLYLGPVGWYDVERTNGVLRRELLLGQSIEYEKWIGLSRIASHFDVAQSKLANLFGNAVTILTTDGKVGYQERGIFQSVGGGQLSSAVAENVNRYFDETDPNDSSRLLNPVDKEMKLSDGPNNDYDPKVGKPHPVAAVRRGLNEETSWRMTDYVAADGIKCTGLCFGLDSLHPDAQWIVLVKITADEFERECKDHPGKDWREGRIRFVPADFEDIDTQQILSRPEWISAGKASMVRAIELVTVVGRRTPGASATIFDVLARMA